MMDRPVIFSAPMVRALLDGRKTMTRRYAWHTANGDDAESFPTPWQKVQPGDRLWVRESMKRDYLPHLLTGEPTNAEIAVYSADDKWAVDRAGFNFAWQWRGKAVPSIHMPRWASRLTLIVTATKIERLQDITPDDVRAEGLLPATKLQHGAPADDDLLSQFEELWDRLHGEGAWLSNPEVVALTFTVHKTNIDALEVAAA